MKKSIALVVALIMVCTITSSSLVFADKKTSTASAKNHLKSQAQSVLNQFYSLQSKVDKKKKTLNTAYKKVKSSKIKKQVNALKSSINTLDREIQKTISKAKAKSGAVKSAVNKNNIDSLEGIASYLLGLYGKVQSNYSKENIMLDKAIKLCKSK